MNLDKAEKQARLTSIGTIILGAGAFAGITVIYVFYGARLNSLTMAEPNPQLIASLIKAVKLFGFVLLPLSYIALLLLGIATLVYCNKIRKHLAHELGRNPEHTDN